MKFKEMPNREVVHVLPNLKGLNIFRWIKFHFNGEGVVVGSLKKAFSELPLEGGYVLLGKGTWDFRSPPNNITIIGKRVSKLKTKVSNDL